jgi:hypothetical protein
LFLPALFSPVVSNNLEPLKRIITMGLLKRSFHFIVLSLVSISAFSQEDVPQFTVQVGNFVNPKPSDFSHLNSVGFVYAVQRPSNYMDVFIGGYSSQTEADRVAQNLKMKGYDNAYVSKLNVEGGQPATVIQLAIKTVGDKINWQEFMEAGKLYFTINGPQIKIATGIFSDVESAKAQLVRLQNLGFKDAFVKNVNNALLHEVTDFETGGTAKKPLIPLDLSAKPEEIAKKTDVPTTYEDVAIVSTSPAEDKILTSKGAPVPAQKTTPPIEAVKEPVKEPAKPAPVFTPKGGAPNIRADVKRNSALELQKVLKEEGTYKSSLDGYYGKGTKAAYEQALKTIWQLQKYRILALQMARQGEDAPKDAVQFFINNLWGDPKDAIAGLEASKTAIAKAYRAYYMFVNNGASKDVNLLMNEAIQGAFSGKKLARFDHTATYAYFDIEQLLLHIRYIHEVSPEKPAAPCWLFRRHPGPALQAFGESGGGANEVPLQNCGGFWEWETAQILGAIAQDISAKGKFTSDNSQLSRLFLTPTAVSAQEAKALEEWNDKLWRGIEGWATRDPMLAEVSTALKISYFQTYVLLEDFFMNEGFDAKASKGLALSALRAMVGSSLDRFI